MCDYLYLLHVITEDTISLNCKKLALLGPPKVGKTAFQALFFNWLAPKHHHSTAIASRSVQVVERITDIAEDKVWDVVKAEEVLETLSDAISDEKKEPEDKATGVSSSTLQHLQSKTPDMSLEGKSSNVDFTSPKSVNNKTPMHKLAIKMAKQECSNKIPVTVLQLSEYRKSKGGKRSRELHKATWVHVLDSGGQLQFADVSRAFLRGNAVNFILVKLTEKLSDKPSFVYSVNGTLISVPSELQMTNLQLIEHYVHSVAASNTCTVSIDGKEISTKPFFVIIGTYYDKVKGLFFSTTESIEEKNKQILSTLEEFHDQFIFHNKSSNELIFPVNNLCWINRKKISDEIRERIMSQEGIGFKVPIPIRWYLFELQMREKGSSDHGIVSIESCYDIGTTLGMSKKDVKTSLVHFDSLTLCLYYEKVLPNVIFTNPQYLLDILSGLVCTSFVVDLTLVLPKGVSLSPDTQQMLQRDGVFEESILDDLGLPFLESLFPPRDFLLLLQYLFIVSPIPIKRSNSTVCDSTVPDSTVQRFFMPILLPPVRMSEEQKKAFIQTCDPLIITFNSKLVPQGLFPTLIVSLLSRRDKPHFFIDSRSPLFPRQLRHAVKLFSERLFGSIFLCDNLKSIEIIFTGRTRHCYTLHQVILECLSASAELLSYDMKALISVRCMRHHTLAASNDEPHPITVCDTEYPPVVGCSLENDHSPIPIDNKRQYCWLKDLSSVVRIDNIILPEGSVLNESHAPIILKAISKIVNEWETLGLFLGIENEELKLIHSKSFYQIDVSRKDMIVHWLKTGTATREKLIQALEDLGRNDVAAEVKRLPKH
ncbi:PREDICTED: uncharacterized protein LOC109590346 [Amphimedon queenslandica]|uniref:Death domain-containing protein n=1 Tax=Amphimedon queenslandica TaxID=400682 RepID=A0AAN0JXJ4_AMPQE|nr:PREDICTED: uncharacterized protein LOC109590346 [Amphimedon queenslandica]|eukprot:XP_019861827.1 PREDICTED: uncharacterized protein LOC109590346 [Amphimedon queenslandica]